MTKESDEVAVLAAIPYDGAEAYSIRAQGVSPQKRRHVLARLAYKGLVEIWPNGWGPETPEWWMRTSSVLERWEPSFEIERGMLFDRYEANFRPVVFVELSGEVNEFGCARGTLKAGTNNARVVWIHRYHLESGAVWVRRMRGEVTAWSAKFACEVHGECSEDMVTTKKTCSLCGTLLLRLS
jgi:hypothetical protein